MDLRGKINIIPGAVGEQYPVGKADLQDAGVFVLKIGVSAVNPGGKSLFQGVDDCLVFRFAHIA